MKQTIFISSLVKDCDYSVGRPSILGNPFKMRTEEERDIVCDNFEKYFEEKIKNNDTSIFNELRLIKEKAITSNKEYFKLGCFCSPRRCHADTIARFLNIYKDSV